MLRTACDRRCCARPSAAQPKPPPRLEWSLPIDSGSRPIAFHCSIDHRDFPGVRPGLSNFDEASANGILVHIIPFIGIALTAAQNMIVKSRLPKRGQDLARKSRWPNRGIGQCRAQLPLHAFDPFAQRDRAVATETDKEMHVIRHDHVTTDNYSEFRRMMAIFDESSMNRCPSQNLAPCMSVEGEQINRRLEPREQPIYSGRFPFDLPLHKECCSARFPQRISN